MIENYKRYKDTSNILGYMTKYTGGSVRHAGIRMTDIQSALLDLYRDSEIIIEFIFNSFCSKCKECSCNHFADCPLLFPMAYRVGNKIRIKEHKGIYKILAIDNRIFKTYKVCSFDKKCEFSVGFINEAGIKTAEGL
jgi:hypothetical protein